MVRYPVARPTLGERERAAVLDAFDSGWVSSSGRYVDEIRARFPPAVGAIAGVPCSSGTSALHLALLALAAGPGDEILVPAFTYVAAANAPLVVGATPVLVDADPATWAIDPERLESLRTPRTRGVIAAHLYGIVADLTLVRAFCDRHGLWLIEDCAQALGAPLGARRPGAWGELSTWSFFGNKLLTAGEGGFVTTATRADLIERADGFRNQSMDPDRRYVHHALGFNYRLSNLQCALLCAQLDSLAAFRAARDTIRATYDAALASAVGAGRLCAPPQADVCWLYAVVLDPDAPAESRDAIATRLERTHGIETRPFPAAMQHNRHLRAACRGPLPVAERLARTGLSLPTWVGLETADVRTIAAAVDAELGALETTSAGGRSLP